MNFGERFILGSTAYYILQRCSTAFEIALCETKETVVVHESAERQARVIEAGYASWRSGVVDAVESDILYARDS